MSLGRSQLATYSNIAGAATTVVKKGPGAFLGIVFNKAVASGVVTIYDNTSATGTKIATITNPGTLLQNNFDLAYMCQFTNGLTVVTSSTDDITIIYV